jgi:NADH-quinone oxidoreductase subunit F
LENKILLANINTPDFRKFETFRKLGGYVSVEKALKTMSPENVTDEVKKSGLRGRGGAGFPTGLKWSFMDKNTHHSRYLLCNADEGEPGTFKDHYLILHNPHLLIEGIILSSYALGVNKAYIFIRGELFYLIKILDHVIKELYEKGFLGKNILGTDFNLDIYCHPGGGAYICGEETALIEALEGKRGNPRMKPPYPAVNGLYGNPTVVNNVETLASIPWIINNGGEEYAKIGIGKSTGTKLISACGHINKPGVYEIEMGLPVEEFIYSDKYLSGIKNKNKLKAVIAGGSSVPILPTELILKTAQGKPRLLSYESLADGGFETGTMLGSGGFIVMDHTTCMVKSLFNYTRFYHHESCGQCSPCREGTGWMEKILQRIESGQGNMRDINLLDDIAKHVEGNTICPLGDAAAWPVGSSILHFREEFEDHVKNKKCTFNNG